MHLYIVNRNPFIYYYFSGGVYALALCMCMYGPRWDIDVEGDLRVLKLKKRMLEAGGGEKAISVRGDKSYRLSFRC